MARDRMTQQQIIKIYTDGACRGNPGPGGWGVVLQYNGHEKHLYGSETHTTNNRMELTATIQALKTLKRHCTAELTTDSRYVQDGIKTWVKKWKHNGWKTSKKEPVKNADLWQQLDTLAAQHQVTWHWIKAHNGHRENELADSLANQGIDELLKK